MKPPLYLARDSFRRRRAMDAARLLPFVGIFLFALPMLWGTAEDPGAATAREGLYLFAVWAGLILAAGLLARVLAAGLDEGLEEGPERTPTRTRTDTRTETRAREDAGEGRG